MTGHYFNSLRKNFCKPWNLLWPTPCLFSAEHRQSTATPLSSAAAFQTHSGESHTKLAVRPSLHTAKSTQEHWSACPSSAWEESHPPQWMALPHTLTLSSVSKGPAHPLQQQRPPLYSSNYTVLAFVLLALLRPVHHLWVGEAQCGNPVQGCRQ